MGVFRPPEFKPYGLIENSTRNVVSDKYRDNYDAIFRKKPKEQTAPRGYTKYITRNGVTHKITSQEELDAFEAKYGKITMRRIEI